MADVGAVMAEIGRTARAAAAELRTAPGERRTRAIAAMADGLDGAASAILAANAQDLAAATHLPPPMQDRLRLDEALLRAMSESLRTVAAIPDPVGAEIARWTRPNGLDIARVRTPIGVIAVIYEARPNVTADAAALCLRAGNAVVLRGGSEFFCTPTWRSMTPCPQRSQTLACRPGRCRSCRRRTARPWAPSFPVSAGPSIW